MTHVQTAADRIEQEAQKVALRCEGNTTRSQRIAIIAAAMRAVVEQEVELSNAEFRDQATRIVLDAAEIFKIGVGIEADAKAQRLTRALRVLAAPASSEGEG